MSHLSALRGALAAERDFTRAEHDRMVKLPAEDRVAVGVSWPTVRVEVCDLLPWGGTRIEVRAPRGVVLHDGISAGQPIDIRFGGESYAGSVRGRDDQHAEIRLRDDVEMDGQVEVIKRFDPTTFERYLAALDEAESLDSPLVKALLGEIETIEPDASMRFNALNASQKAAAAHARGATSLALLHGPPGTGKTHTIVSLVGVLVEDGEAPLALADSNAATDHLAVRIADEGLKVVRLGSPARIGSQASSLSLDATVARGPYGKAIATMERDLVRLRSAGDFGAWRTLRRELRDLRKTARDHALNSAQVLACTLGSLPRFAESLGPRRTAIVDEATQAIEPAIWTAVPRVERLILVGDPDQLGPVVLQPGNPLGRSLFERLLGEGRPAARLDVQHRMHHTIQALVEGVYGASYTAHDAVAEHILAELPQVAATPFTTQPVRFIDTAGAGFEDARDPITRSTYNEGEVRLVELVVQSLLDAGVPAEDVGVIAPYSAQVQRLSGLGVEVATVNAFQGREKEVIVCSFVRSNHIGELGFVADRRRLTVAITRARRAWIGVGDSATLSVDKSFADLFARVVRVGELDSVWVEPWSAVLD